MEIFESEYLRSPNEAGITRLLHVAKDREFSRMLSILDCMHWQWDKRPTSYHCMYTGHVHKPTVILKVVASYDLWIWHAFFGMPRSFNDINVLDISFPYLMNFVVVMPLLQNLSSMGDNTNWDTILLMAFIQNEQPLSTIRELVKETLFTKIQ